ncbi:zinc-binding dehydrogenase [Agromyces mediolanus]|uniref:alcohol dehydrogenase catalytic domain-containing protein n=1 Tax=Agromyces mediolanus TaxID=41986 RepID=UPI00203AEF30|nr:zinc-binding dehydrogenase [Agromyces mediolanus]MCM3658106.1 zinc-binding dehydrogenase [Agromyces mediolanus]
MPSLRSPRDVHGEVAVRFDRFGSVDQLALRPVAAVVLAPDQVRIRVTVAGLNPVDWQIVESPSLAAAFGIAVPAGYGNDFAGVVVETGEAVTRWRVGDRVFGGARGRAVASSVVLEERHPSLHRTPDGVDDLTAGVLDIAGRTASAVARALAVAPGETVLVGGAGGGVGSILTQLLVHAGAQVVGTGSASSAPFLRSIGAEPLTYGEGLAGALRASGARIAAAADLHGVATALAARELGVPARRIVTIESEDPPAGVVSVNGSDAHPGDLQRILALVVEGRLTVPIAGVYPVERFSDAIAQQRSRHARGKIAIVLPADPPASVADASG